MSGFLRLIEDLCPIEGKNFYPERTKPPKLVGAMYDMKHM